MYFLYKRSNKNSHKLSNAEGWFVKSKHFVCNVTSWYWHHRGCLFPKDELGGTYDTVCYLDDPLNLFKLLSMKSPPHFHICLCPMLQDPLVIAVLSFPDPAFPSLKRSESQYRCSLNSLCATYDPKTKHVVGCQAPRLWETAGKHESHRRVICGFKIRFSVPTHRSCHRTGKRIELMEEVERYIASFCFLLVCSRSISKLLKNSRHVQE